MLPKDSGYFNRIRYIEITCPTLRGINFKGFSKSEE